jgi:hypothetical protein
MFSSTLTMTSVLASVSAALAIGTAPSAAAAPHQVPSSLVDEHAIETGAGATHRPHVHGTGIAPATTSQRSAAVIRSAAPAYADRWQEATRSSSCVRPKAFHVDSQGRTWSRGRDC